MLLFCFEEVWAFFFCSLDLNCFLRVWSLAVQYVFCKVYSGITFSIPLSLSFFLSWLWLLHRTSLCIARR